MEVSVETYDEDFTPVEVTIKITSMNELAWLCARLSVHNGHITVPCNENEEYPEINQEFDPTWPVWEALNNVYKERSIYK